MLDTVLDFLDAQRDEIIALQRRMTAIPALGPLNGGDGERRKADDLILYLKSLGLPEAREFSAPDDRVSCGHRPNLAVVIPGADASRTFWTISHIDVVPPGDLSLWDSDPYELVVDGDILRGRGVEDNQQAIAASVILAKALAAKGLTPPMNYGMLFVADEETGSKHGLDYVLAQHPGIFTPRDLFLIPDFGRPDGEMVEVAEKSMLWLKFSLFGRQCHASTPDEGRNTFVAASDLALRLLTLHETFPDQDELFAPPRSTFSPTKKEANVENINTIPGRDVFYMDCRVLPVYDLDDVLAAVRDICAAVADARGVEVAIEIVQKEQASPATPLDSEIVTRLLPAIRAVCHNDPRPMGIGGGTVAAFLRKRGFAAVVWSCLMHNAHQPNEQSSIAKTIADAKVMARVLLDR
ncbi:M20 family metallo-hydrolase [Desulfolutivibrio sp.]|uniref:M20 family metallo-hydrolase n=1 Tax=Desulfolutivibrio sp. TaxID=2773296 RepID=UPI002F96E70B